LFQVVRFEPKDFRQRRPLGGGKWAWEIRGVARVPYRLPGLIAGVKEGRTIYITEGEKAADSLTVLGVATTCSPHGAGKWRDEYSAYLKDADVVILPDNDKPGEQHAAMVANSLRGIAKRVRLLRLAGIPSGGDVYD
jgi:DNA primase